MSTQAYNQLEHSVYESKEMNEISVQFKFSWRSNCQINFFFNGKHKIHMLPLDSITSLGTTVRARQNLPCSKVAHDI